MGDNTVTTFYEPIGDVRLELTASPYADEETLIVTACVGLLNSIESDVVKARITKYLSERYRLDSADRDF